MRNKLLDTRRMGVLAIALCLAGGCKPQATDGPAADADTAAGPTTSTDAPEAPSTAPPGQAGAEGVFDLDKIPVSDAPLGDFPYFSLPEGYVSHKPTDYAFDRFPFWVGDRFEWVEGKVHSADIYSKGDHRYAPLEMLRNVESMIAAAGGVKVPTDEPDSSLWQKVRTEINMINRYPSATCFPDPIHTFVVRRLDKTIWMQLCTRTNNGGWVIAETRGFEATAKLLPAAELKQQLDTAGKVALQVNFATDKTRILAESLPQIDQVVQLLKDDPALELSIQGHTDNSGDAAHNQRLSEGRAQAVVSAITAKGIDATRLAAKGFGASQPVADNATDEGKAKNRRVELHKQ